MAHEQDIDGIRRAIDGRYMAGAFAHGCTLEVVRRSILRAELGRVRDGLSFIELVKRIRARGWDVRRRTVRRDLAALGARRYSVGGCAVYRVLA